MSVHRQFARFATVGVACFALTLATFTLLHGAGVHYIAAAVIGYSAGVGLGFALNRSWTFAATAGEAHRQAIRFLIVSALGIALNAALLRLLVAGLELAELPSEVVAVAVTAPVTFTINRFWSFA